MDLNTQVKGTLIIQKVNVGRISTSSIKKEETRYSASGNAFAKAMGLKKEKVEATSTPIETGAEDTKESSDSGNLNNKTTRSYSFQADANLVPELLTKFDNSHSDAAFQRKMSELIAKRESLKLNDLRGKDKATALKELQPYGFTAYTIQVFINLPIGTEYKGDSIIHSKKLHYVQIPSTESVKKRLDGVEWIAGEPQQDTPQSEEDKED